jgi:hypothetical protein
MQYLSQNSYYNYIFVDLNKPGNYHYEGLNFSFLYEPFYVGKGKLNRYKNHIYELPHSRTRKSNKLRNCLKHFSIEDITIFLNKDSENGFVKDKEKYLISKIGRLILDSGPLTNITDGGDGRGSEDMRIWNNTFWDNDENRAHLSDMIKTKQWDSKKGEQRKLELSNRVKGSSNPSAKIYIITDNKNNDYFIHGNLKSFAEENELSINILRNWVNRGIISPTSSKDNSFHIFPSKVKLLGWKINELKRVNPHNK